MKIEAITLLASAACDLQCKYCYIPQDVSAKKQAELLNKFKTTNFLDPALKICDNVKDITTMGFWGLEPTKSLEVISERLDYIFNSLPNLATFSFSSNFQGDVSRVTNFIKKLGKERKIFMGIQASLDGMPRINDLNRGKGSGNKVISNLKKLIKDLVPILQEQQNINVSLSDKSTLSAVILEEYEKNPNLLYENFRFINNLYSELHEMVHSSHANIRLNFGGINQEHPFDFTKEHGISFTKMIKNLDHLIREEHLKYVALPLMGKIQRVVKFGSEFNNKHLMFVCGASRGNMSIGFDDSFLPFCHRDFFPTTEKSIEKFSTEYYSIHCNSDNIVRHKYLTSCYSDFPKLKLQHVIIMCKELAYCGLIDKSYDNYEKAYLLAMFLAAESCPSAGLAEFCSPHVKDIGYIKLLANGAFDYLLERVIKP